MKASKLIELLYIAINTVGDKEVINGEGVIIDKIIYSEEYENIQVGD